MKILILLSPLFVFDCFGQSLQNESNQNISSEHNAILKANEDIWPPINDDQGAYFINLQIKNGYIVWRTNAQINDGQLIINECWSDSVIVKFVCKDFVCNDSIIFSETGNEERVKVIKKIIFPSYNFECLQKVSSLAFNSACF